MEVHDSDGNTYTLSESHIKHSTTLSNMREVTDGSSDKPVELTGISPSLFEKYDAWVKTDDKDSSALLKDASLLDMVNLAQFAEFLECKRLQKLCINTLMSRCEALTVDEIATQLGKPPPTRDDYKAFLRGNYSNRDEYKCIPGYYGIVRELDEERVFPPEAKKAKR